MKSWEDQMLKEVMRGCHTILWLLNLGGLGWAGGSLTRLATRPDWLIGQTGVEGESNSAKIRRRSPLPSLPPTSGSTDVRFWKFKRVQAAAATDVIFWVPQPPWCRETHRTSGVNYRVNWLKLDHHIFSGHQSGVISVIVRPYYSNLISGESVRKK